jgi:uncharacterized membrane protein (DUF485 family)
MMLVTIPFPDGSGSTGSRSGYTSMVLAFLVIFFGVRTYRYTWPAAPFASGAFAVGALIAVIASLCYVFDARLFDEVPGARHRYRCW